jgi:hypothetical protein
MFNTALPMDTTILARILIVSLRSLHQRGIYITQVYAVNERF